MRSMAAGASPTGSSLNLDPHPHSPYLEGQFALGLREKGASSVSVLGRLCLESMMVTRLACGEAPREGSRPHVSIALVRSEVGPRWHMPDWMLWLFKIQPRGVHSVPGSSHGRR